MAGAVGAQGHQLLELLQVEPQSGSSERARDRRVRPGGQPSRWGRRQQSGPEVCGSARVASWTPPETAEGPCLEAPSHQAGSPPALGAAWRPWKRPNGQGLCGQLTPPGLKPQRPQPALTQSPSSRCCHRPPSSVWGGSLGGSYRARSGCSQRPGASKQIPVSRPPKRKVLTATRVTSTRESLQVREGQGLPPKAVTLKTASFQTLSPSPRRLTWFPTKLEPRDAEVSVHVRGLRLPILAHASGRAGG